MKLEDEIKQEVFKHEWSKATVNILFTHHWLTNQIKKVLKEFGITSQQYNVLRILKGSYPKPITTSTIRDRMLDKMSDASRIVDRLHKKDLVIRTTCSTDKRLVDITISDEGIELLKRISHREKDIECLLNLTEEEAAVLNKLLDKSRG